MSAATMHTVPASHSGYGHGYYTQQPSSETASQQNFQSQDQFWNQPRQDAPFAYQVQAQPQQQQQHFQQQPRYDVGYGVPTNNVSRPPMPSTPPPPVPSSSDELALITFDGPSSPAYAGAPPLAVAPTFDSASSASAPSDTFSLNHIQANQQISNTNTNDRALVPFESSPQTESNPELDRIIASQQRAMERASKRSMVPVNNAAKYGAYSLTANKVGSVGGISASSSNRSIQRSSQQMNGKIKASSQAGVHPQRKEMKRQRKVKTAGGVIGGAVLGGLILGPVGVVLGGAAGGAGARKAAKSGEKRAQSRFEQRNVQKAALSSGATRGAAFA